MENREGLHEIDHLFVGDRQSLLPRGRQQAVLLKRFLVAHVAFPAQPDHRKHLIFTDQLVELFKGDAFPERRPRRLSADHAEIASELPRREEPHERHDDHDGERAEQPAAVFVENGVDFLDNHLRGILSM
ncbi:hypothetical protein SDC9_144700 [bioreactor metagenome]|uniref:Uncharacterized protein n=1 Tax=bioreactor metagenome TaxID=1076179 RepID=A0A645E7G7_9ZZZZ